MTLSQEETNTTTRPLLLEYMSESMERQRQEELYRPASRTFQWCIAPVVFVATMVPVSILLMQTLRSEQAGSMYHTIALIPTISVGVDVMGIGVVLVSILGLFGVAKGCRWLMNLYFGLVICFIAVQVGNAIAGLLSGSDWIEEALDKSWDIAYQTDQGIIQELQAGFHCMGFRTLDDRVVPMPYNTEMDQPPCEGILRARFGRRLQRLGSLVIYIRLIQLVGVLMLSILFRYLTTMEPLDEDEATSRDEELPYFKSEKEMEEESARVPLLGGDDDEMPGYWQEYGEAESDGEERDEDERDEEMWRIYGDQLSVPAPARWRS